MDKKKILILVAIIAIVLVVAGIILMGGNKGPKTASTEVTLEPWYCKATFTVPATKNDNNELEPTYKVEEETKGGNDCGIANDKVAIELDYSSWSYTSYANYKAKYGDKAGSYANYLEYLKDAEFDSQKTLKSDNVKEVKVGEYNAIQQKYMGNMKYTLDVEGTKGQIQLVIVPLNEGDKVDDLLTDAEISSIINSVKIEVK